MQSSRERLLEARANLKTKQSLLVILLVVVAIWLVHAIDPSYDYHSVALIGNLHEDTPVVGTKQTCANGIWNERTHELEENSNCTSSAELLHMERPKTDKNITYMLLYYNAHKHLAHQVKAWKNF